MNKFDRTQNFLGHVTAKIQNEFWALQSAMEELVKMVHVLAESQPQAFIGRLNESVFRYYRHCYQCKKSSCMTENWL
jgi:hypothetical protein